MELLDKLLEDVHNEAWNRGEKVRILFISEAVTVVHVARPLFLAQALDPEKYDILFACDPRFQWMLKDQRLCVRTIHSISPRLFMRSLERGTPLYDEDTLRDHVFEDLVVIREFSPDLIIEDFRLSLAVSAPYMKVPCISITKGSWRNVPEFSPAESDPYINRLFGPKLGPALINVIRPPYFSGQFRFFGRVKKEFSPTAVKN